MTETYSLWFGCEVAGDTFRDLLFDPRLNGVNKADTRVLIKQVSCLVDPRPINAMPTVLALLTWQELAMSLRQCNTVCFAGSISIIYYPIGNITESVMLK